MILGRREKPGLSERVRETVWPRSGPRRASTYIYKRVLRLRATPHGIAAGFAAGAFASFTPFIGFHFILGFCVAWLARGSLIAAALGTAIGNPITFPLIWTTTYQLGSWVLGRSADGIADDGASGRVLSPEAVVDGLVPMVLGGIIIGGIFAAIVYFPLRMAVYAYQSRRQAKLAEQAAAQASARQSAVEDDAYQGDAPDLAAGRTSVGG